MALTNMDSRASPVTQAQTASAGTQPGTVVDQEQIFQWIKDLSDPARRENALLELRYPE